MTFAQRRNRLTTHFSERIPVVKRRVAISGLLVMDPEDVRSPKSGGHPELSKGTELFCLGIILWGTVGPSEGLGALGPTGLEPNY